MSMADMEQLQDDGSQLRAHLRRLESRPKPAPVDFSSVPGHQWEMHGRLLNWALASRNLPLTGHQVSAGFELYRSSDSRREYGAITVTVVDQRDAAKVNAGVVALPEKLRSAIQWYYLRNGKNPAGEARDLGVTMEQLAGLVCEGRQALLLMGV